MTAHTERSFGPRVAATLFAICVLPLGPIIWSSLWLVLFLRLNWLLCALLLLYSVWYFFFDSGVSRHATRVSGFVRGWSAWKYLAAYFQTTMHKSADLDPKGRYVIGYHPHGVVSLGAFIAFGTGGAGIAGLFPGINFHLCTLPINFSIPFIRELLALLGIIDSSRQAISRQLSPGRAVVLVVGGAREAMETQPGSNQLVLITRKGFVREAVLGQATLVPCFSFGENEIYDTLNPRGLAGRCVRCLQKRGLLSYGYSLPVFWGFVPYTPIPGGIVPKATRLTLVLGNPLPPPALGKFEEEGRLDIVFKQRFNAGQPYSPFGFEGQAARGDVGMIVCQITKDPRAAWGVRSLERGMLVTMINGQDVTGVKTEEIQRRFNAEATPVTVSFTDGLVTTWHSQYIAELQRIHDENKERYGRGGELVIN